MVALGSGDEVLGASSQCSSHQTLIASALHLQSSTRLAAARDISLLEVHQNPINKGTIITAKMSLTSSIPRPLLSTMYLVKEAETGNNYIAGRILDRQWIDSSLPGVWKATCGRLHDGLCKRFPDAALSSTRPAWLVDVSRKCIVVPPKNCSYVALSYVWGNQVTLQTTKSNIHELRQAGSLSARRSPVPIAETIRDAMGIVELLDERYLWIDSLCIIQDDETQKHREMDNMAMIYANASVSIMAVQGEDANSGIRGFRNISGPRKLGQSVHYLMDRATVIQSPIDANTLEVGTENPTWQTRGWTYQENLFSRRRLVFTGDSVRWECAASTWREHVHFHTDPAPCYNGTLSGQSLFQSLIPDLATLQSILKGFNVREFTYPEDALQAFAGISSLASTSFAGGFLSGLPISLFDLGLLWQPYDKMLRRAPKDLAKHCHLPSWSWAGWFGPVTFDDASASDFIRNSPARAKRLRERRILRTLQWKFHETLTSPGKPIHAAILDCRDMWLEEHVEVPQGWSRHGISESPDAFYEPPDPRLRSSMFSYRHEAHPGHEFWYPIPLLRQGDMIPSVIAPYISCRTRRAWLKPGEKLPKNNGYQPVISLRDEKGIWAGTLQPHDGLNSSKDALQDPKAAIELVEIAKGFCRDSTSPWPGIEEIRHPERPKVGQWYAYYWVMWVRWVGTIAYRQGLGRVHTAMWEEQRGGFFDMMLG